MALKFNWKQTDPEPVETPEQKASHKAVGAVYKEIMKHTYPMQDRLVSFDEKGRSYEIKLKNQFTIDLENNKFYHNRKEITEAEFVKLQWKLERERNRKPKFYEIWLRAIFK